MKITTRRRQLLLPFDGSGRTSQEDARPCLVLFPDIVKQLIARLDAAVSCGCPGCVRVMQTWRDLVYGCVEAFEEGEAAAFESRKRTETVH